MKSILLVTADQAARAALVQTLGQDGYQVSTARNGREARAALRSILPGAIVIDLPLVATQRLVDHLTGSRALQLIPRLVVMPPLELGAPIVAAAAVLVRPVPPGHLSRVLASLYPRGAWNVPAADAVKAVHKAERIRAVIEQVATEPAPVVAPPATINVATMLPERPSARAISVAQSYVIEVLEERVALTA